MRRIILHPSAFRLPASAFRLLCSVLCLLFSVLCLPSFALTDSWGVDVNAHTAVQRTYKQGETWEMRIALRDGLKPLNLTGATARFYWYTNSTDNVWWTNSAAIYAPALGVVSAPWTPAMDTGAASYAYWVGIWMPGSTSPLWRVTGTIRLLPSPGFTPNALVPPVRTLDFAAITLTNAPWVTSSDWQSGSNALAAALQALDSRVDAIPPPPVASVNGSTGAVSITAASLGALTAEADPVAGPRLALIEGQTNNWRQAYAWGNHAGAGYLLSSAWNTWLSTNTYVKTELDQTALAALAAFAETNNLTRWRSSSTNWLEYAGNGVITNFILTPVMTGPWWHFEGTDFIESAIPHPVNVVVTDRWSILYDGNGYEFNLVGTEWWGYLAVFDDQNGPVLLTNRVSFAETNLVYSLVHSSAVSTNFVVYNLTTGNVWQAVSSVKQTADDALLAADQAATLINYHTTLDGNPHAGKFVTPLQLTNALMPYATVGDLENYVLNASGTAANLALTGNPTLNGTNIGPILTSAITNGGYAALYCANISSGAVGTDEAPLKVCNTNTYAAPYTQFSQVWLHSSGTFSIASLRNDGLFQAGRVACGQLTLTPNGSAESPAISDGIGQSGIYFVDSGLSVAIAANNQQRLVVTDLGTAISNNLTVAKTNTAAVIVSQGPVFFGPVINGKQMFLDGDATNAWIVNVNSVTNAL